jgi:flagellar hook-basal body complex protein FliE
MEINGISAQYLETLSKLSKADGADASGFQDILSEAIDAANSTDAVDKASAQALLTGDVNNIADALIDSEKATIALELTIQIRNKIIDAYNEVMRMQI